MFTSSKLKMGEFVNPTWLKLLAYLVATVIAGLNVWLLFQTVRGWLAWGILPHRSPHPRRLMYARILVPLEHSDYDDAILVHIGELARMHKSTVVLIHVADGWAARNQQALAARSRRDV